MNHTCHATLCETRCPPTYLMCGRHWAMVPKFLQRDVWATYREGQCDDKKPSQEWCRAADRAIEFVFSVESYQNGTGGFSPVHKRPDGQGDSSMERQDLIAAHTNALNSSIHALEVQVTIIKQLFGKGGKAAKVAKATESDDDDADEEEEEDEAPKTKKRKASKASDDDEEEEEEEEDEEPVKKTKKASKASDDDEDEEEEEDAPKAKKGKKLTVEDVNKACIKRMKRTDFKEVQAFLKKTYGTKSINDIDEDLYAECIERLGEE